MDAVPFLPGPALVRGRPVVAGRPGGAAHRFQFAHVPVLEPLVVGPAEHGAVPDPVIVALAQRRAARVTRETLDVVHEVFGSHHQVARADTALAPGTTFYRKQPADNRVR